MLLLPNVFSHDDYCGMTDHSIQGALPIVADSFSPLRFVTAASLFDGHDASISIVRRILQDQGCEVIHLGHNRSVAEIVDAAIQEDAHGIAVSSYQGGHVEFFKFMVDLLRSRGAGHVRVFGGGGGVIVPAEREDLMSYGVECIYSPEDGQRLGLAGMITDMMDRARRAVRSPRSVASLMETLAAAGRYETSVAPALSELISQAENALLSASERAALSQRAAQRTMPVLGVTGTGGAALPQPPAQRPKPVLGVTGTGGAGKSSLTDELVLRFRIDSSDSLRVAVISIDPSRRKSMGALLGDRIRMNAINTERIFMRSMATRDAGSEISKALPLALDCCRLAGFDLAIVETSGIGQGDAAVVPFVDKTLYVMTPEFGAASQLEKIDMLDFADFVAINKFDRRGGQDALRDVSKQFQRNKQLWSESLDNLPVFDLTTTVFWPYTIGCVTHSRHLACK